jgi:hypothetical protein
MALDAPTSQYARILLFAALLLPFCAAAAVDDAALRYLSSGEAASASVTNFTSGGATYYMVFQGQAEAFLLRQDGQNFSIVSDRSALLAPLKDYIAFKYGAAVSPEKIASIKSQYQALLNASQNCTKPMTDLLLNSPLMTILMNNDYSGNTYNTLTRLNGQNGSKGVSILGISNVSMLQNKSNIHKSLLKGYIAVIVGGMNYLGEMAGNLSESASIADNLALLGQMRAFLAEYKTPLAQYVTDHNFMNTNYPPVLKRCIFGVSSFSTLDSLLAAKTLPSEADLADNLSASAASRISLAAASAEISSILSSEQESAALLLAAAAQARQVLVQYSMEADDLDSVLSQVNASLERTKNSMTKAEADSLHADFQAKLGAANSLVLLLNNASTAAALQAAESALNQTQSAIERAGTRMGEGNANVNNLNQTWESARVAIGAAKAQLAQGKPEAVTALASSASTLAATRATADGLNPLSAQMDIFIIGFVVLVVIIGIVAFFYTRGRKKEPPVVIPAAPGNPALKKATSGIIIERK